jgi:nucleotide-binding universal stress UspA family protein
MSTVVVGYVDSAEGRAALHAGMTEALRRDAQIVVVHSSRGGALMDGDDAVAIKQALQLVQQELTADHVPFHIRNLVRGNEPADDLIAMVEEYDAELLVIGLRHRSSLGKFLLGSDAQRVLMHAQCPVLCVKSTSP